MTPAQNPVIMNVVLAAAFIALIVYHIICRYLNRENQKLRMVNCSAARTIDHLAAFIDTVKVRSRDVKNDPDIQKLAFETLVHVENHRKLRSKNSPQTDLLIKDLKEMSGKSGPRDNLYAAWEAQSVGQQ